MAGLEREARLRIEVPAIHAFSRGDEYVDARD